MNPPGRRWGRQALCSSIPEDRSKLQKCADFIDRYGPGNILVRDFGPVGRPDRELRIQTSSGQALFGRFCMLKTPTAPPRFQGRAEAMNPLPAGLRLPPGLASQGLNPTAPRCSRAGKTIREAPGLSHQAHGYRSPGPISRSTAPQRPGDSHEICKKGRVGPGNRMPDRFAAGIRSCGSEYASSCGRGIWNGPSKWTHQTGGLMNDEPE